jgi:hypothetical protein
MFLYFQTFPFLCLSLAPAPTLNLIFSKLENFDGCPILLRVSILYNRKTLKVCFASLRQVPSDSLWWLTAQSEDTLKTAYMFVLTALKARRLSKLLTRLVIWVFVSISGHIVFFHLPQDLLRSDSVFYSLVWALQNESLPARQRARSTIFMVSGFLFPPQNPQNLDFCRR